jgi:general secretion pathway protein F
MAIFRYKVCDAAGQVSETLVEGESKADAARRLRRRSLLPLEYLGEGSAAVAGGRALGLVRRRFDVIEFTDRLVPLLQAHIPLERALAILAEGIEDPFSAEVIADLRRGLHEGRKLSQLIRDRGRLFPNVYASVVEAGEEAGALPQVMADLRTFLLERREMRAFVLSASIYPCVVLVVAVLVCALLLGVIVPRFAEALLASGQQPPASAQFLLGIAKLWRGWWWLGVLLPAGAALVILRAGHDGTLRLTLDEWLLRLPVLGRLTLYSNLARMARTMAILMRSGVHLLDTVAIAARVLENSTIRRSIAGLASQLRQGQRLSTALGGSRFIPPFLLRMLAVGEETGSVEAMLERVAEHYETDLRRAIRRALGLLEPVTIIVLGVLVGGIVLTMFMALWDMQGGY